MPLPQILALRSCDYPGTVWDCITSDRFVQGIQDYAWLLDYMRIHGCPFPVLVENNLLRDGHHRVAVAVELGFADLPVTGTWDECGAPVPVWNVSAA
jgi:hypothetical protein